jgi:hypothetical protein
VQGIVMSDAFRKRLLPPEPLASVGG